MAPVGIRVFDVNERRIADIFIITFQDVVRDAFATSILDIIRLLHFSLIVPVEDIRVQDQYRKCNEICLVYIGVSV